MLYLFTCYVILLSTQTCLSDIVISYKDENIFLARMGTQITPLGTSLPRGGIKGYLVKLRSCKGLTSPSTLTGLSGPFIALVPSRILRRECNNDNMQNIQDSGYSGIIIGSHRITSEEITIPIAFGLDRAYEHELEKFFRETNSLLDSSSPTLNVNPEYKVIIASGQDESLFPPASLHVAPGPCPDFKHASNVSRDSLHGSWILARQFSQKFDTCPTFNFRVTSRDSMSIKATSRDSITEASPAVLTARGHTPDVANEAKMQWNWDHLTGFADHVTIVDSDSASHALLQLCNDFGVFHTTYGLVFLRQPIMEAKNYSFYVAKGRSLLAPNVPLPDTPAEEPLCNSHREGKSDGQEDLSASLINIANLISRFQIW